MRDCSQIPFSNTSHLQIGWARCDVASQLPRKALPSLHIAHYYFPSMTETMDNSLSAASILATVGDVNQWTVARFIVDELYTADDDATESVSVDLVKWFNRDGNKMHSSVANKVIFVFFRNFRINSFF